MARGNKRGGLANFGDKRAAPFGSKGGGKVPRGGGKSASSGRGGKK